MEKEFSQYIESRKKFYEQLAKIELHKKECCEPIELRKSVFNKINIDFLEFIKNRNSAEKIKRKDVNDAKQKLLSYFPEFKEIYDYKGAAVYWFKIKSLSLEKDTLQILKSFEKAKKRNKKGWWSKMSSGREHTNYLYLGKVEKNLFDRFFQHIGLGHKQTSSLRICKWITCDLEFQFMKLEDVDKNYLEDIENFLWRKYKPLLGQEPNIKE